MLDKDLIDKIRADFPPESVQVKKGFKDAETGEQMYLTGYKPQYIFERMNDCFGHDGWEYEIVNSGIEGTNAWAKGRLTVHFKDRSVSKDQFGVGTYNKGTPLGDAFKSAATNALEKCASLLDIGHRAYKGLLPVPSDNVNKDDSDREKAKELLKKECVKCKINAEAFETLKKTVLKKEKATAELTVADLNEMTAYLQKNGVPF